MYTNQHLERCAKLCQRTSLDLFEDDNISCSCKDKSPKNRGFSLLMNPPISPNIEDYLIDLEYIFGTLFESDLVNIRFRVTYENAHILSGLSGELNHCVNNGHQIEYSIILEHSRSKLLKNDFLAQSLANHMRDGILDPILEGCGKLVSVRTESMIAFDGFRTMLEVFIADEEQFSKNITKVRWNLYNNEFAKEFESLLLPKYNNPDEK
jgi:hypothetical protein